MDLNIILIVLAAAAMHAGWNAIAKTGADPFLSICLIGIFGGMATMTLLPFLPAPSRELWLWIVGSALIHTGYKLFLIQAYKAGDLSQVYPLARGTAPLIVAIVSIFFLNESLNDAQIVGVVVLVSGIWLMAIRGSATLGRLDRKAVFFAITTSMFIATYTIIDGLAGRIAPTVLSFLAYMTSLDGILMAIAFISIRGTSNLRQIAPFWRQGLIGGIMSNTAFALSIWAMKMAPIALVAALRETSIIFAVLIARVVLKERMTGWRIAAALLIATGIIFMRTS
jgi:drug/metabolite transporter (DMT)-like permease